MTEALSIPIAAILVPIGAYLLGSILPAEIVARRRGFNLRANRKNPGTSEIYRLFGLKPSLLVYAIDAAKGIVPLTVGLALRVPSWCLTVTAAASVAGHNWSLYYRFWGGRGLATASGAFMALLPTQFIVSLMPSLLAWWRTKWVPAAGLVGIPLMMLTAWLLDGDSYQRNTTVVIAILMGLRQLDYVFIRWGRRAQGRETV